MMRYVCNTDYRRRTQIAWSKGKVTQYDTQLVHSSFLFATVIPPLVPLIASELNLPLPTTQAETTALITKRAAIDICTAHEQFCLGDLQQYNSTADCLNFIENEIPFGEVWQSGQDTGESLSLSWLDMSGIEANVNWR